MEMLQWFIFIHIYYFYMYAVAYYIINEKHVKEKSVGNCTKNLDVPLHTSLAHVYFHV